MSRRYTHLICTSDVVQPEQRQKTISMAMAIPLAQQSQRVKIATATEHFGWQQGIIPLPEPVLRIYYGCGNRGSIHTLWVCVCMVSTYSYISQNNVLDVGLSHAESMQPQSFSISLNSIIFRASFFFVWENRQNMKCLQQKRVVLMLRNFQIANSELLECNKG